MNHPHEEETPSLAQLAVRLFSFAGVLRGAKDEDWGLAEDPSYIGIMDAAELLCRNMNELKSCCLKNGHELALEAHTYISLAQRHLEMGIEYSESQYAEWPTERLREFMQETYQLLCESASLQLETVSTKMQTEPEPNKSKVDREYPDTAKFRKSVRRVWDLLRSTDSPQTYDDIEAALNMSRSTISKALKMFEEKGWIQRAEGGGFLLSDHLRRTPKKARSGVALDKLVLRWY